MGDNMERLKKVRKRKGLTQKNMSQLLHVNISTYSRYERGVMQPGLDTLRKISKVLNISTDYLLELSDIPYSSDQFDFVQKIDNNTNPEKILEEFNVTLGGKNVTPDELEKFIKILKQYD